ncbi:unnamed protein product [Sympodiomycopsis kandeliae]
MPNSRASAAGKGSSGTRSSDRQLQPKARTGPNRTSKASGKLKILPEEPEGDAVTPVRPSKLNGQHDSEESSDDDDDDDDDDDQGTGLTTKRDREDREEVYKRLQHIPEGSMRRDARRLTRKGRASLPRVTAYSTATSYRMRELGRFLQARTESHRTNPMTFDECIYSTYSYELVDAARSGHHAARDQQQQQQQQQQQPYHIDSSNSRDHSRKSSGGNAKTGDLLGIPELNEDAESPGNETAGNDSNTGTKSSEGHSASDGTENGHSSNATLVDEQQDQARNLELERQRREEARRERRERFTVKGTTPEVFVMEYGTVVIWGMTQQEEKRLLKEIRKFEVERLAPEDVESEELNWYLADYSRIYNDVITLRRGSSYMTKLSLSHALAQSTKISFFEGVIDDTIDTTKDIPQSIAESGKIGMPPAEIMKQIGHLFILRMNIHLVGSIVDSPEIFWAQPDLEPLYSAARSYLEIPQRIDLLNARVEVLQDMLQLLKDQVTSSHSEWLEIIVIVLIVLEIILGVATMIVDLYFA